MDQIRNIHLYLISLIIISSLLACKINSQSGDNKNLAINIQESEYILFKVGNCIGPCDEQEIIVSKSGLMNYHHKEIYGPRIQYFAYLHKAENKELWEMINAVDWSSVKNDYGLGAEDITPKTLSIFTTDHEIKIMYVHGEPIYIKSIERFLKNLIDITEWTKMTLPEKNRIK